MDNSFFNEFVPLMMSIMPVAYPAFLALLAVLIRLLLHRRSTTFLGFLIDLLSTVLVGYVAGFAADHPNVSEKARIAVVFISSLVGPELIAGFLQIMAIFSRSPVTFILRIVRAISGTPFTNEELRQMMDWERTMMEDIRNPNTNEEENNT